MAISTLRELRVLCVSVVISFSVYVNGEPVTELRWHGSS